MKSQEKLVLLNRVLEGCKSSAFYRDRLPDRALQSLDEIKNIPLTTKEDLRRQSPFGLVSVPRQELRQYHESFGTTGIPVSVWLTREDLRENARAMSRLGVKFNEDDIVLIRYPYALSGVAHIVHAAAQMKKASVIPASSRTEVTPFPRVVNLMGRLQVTVLACLPLQAVLIAEAAEIMGISPRRDFPSLRAICTAGEPLSGGRRKLLEDIWGVPIFDNYGMTETGPAVVDCEFGRPHPLEDCFVFELLGEDLKSEVRLGETGCLVLTTLHRKATPMIRYLTGDRAVRVKNDCPCDSDFSMEIRGRREDVLEIDGIKLDIWDLDEMVYNLPCRRFWVAGPGYRGLHLVVEEERSGGRINPSLLTSLENRYRIKINIEIVPRGTLYERSLLTETGAVGKPRYLYSSREMKDKAYLKSVRV